MNTSAHVQRGLLVFSIWAALGFLGGGFVLEGFERDSIGVSLVGTGLIVTAACAHIVVNAIFGVSFTTGESALGAAIYGVTMLIFILAWLRGGLSGSNYLSGLALFGTLAVGVIAYSTTRYGLRGAFSRFHVQEISGRETLQ